MADFLFLVVTDNELQINPPAEHKKRRTRYKTHLLEYIRKKTKHEELYVLSSLEEGNLGK